jgi:hypothetical protein
MRTHRDGVRDLLVLSMAVDAGKSTVGNQTQEQHLLVLSMAVDAGKSTVGNQTQEQLFTSPKFV